MLEAADFLRTSGSCVAFAWPANRSWRAPRRLGDLPRFRADHLDRIRDRSSSASSLASAMGRLTWTFSLFARRCLRLGLSNVLSALGRLGAGWTIARPVASSSPSERTALSSRYFLGERKDGKASVGSVEGSASSLMARRGLEPDSTMGIEPCRAILRRDLGSPSLLTLDSETEEYLRFLRLMPSFNELESDDEVEGEKPRWTSDPLR